MRAHTGQALPVTLLQVFKGLGKSGGPKFSTAYPQNLFHCSAVMELLATVRSLAPAWTGLHRLMIEVVKWML